MQMALSDAGYQIALAADGATGLELAKSQSPDLIIVELRLPKLSGIEFLRQYFAHPGEHAPVIAVSTSERDAQEALDLGATMFMLKPFDLDDLFERLHESLRSQ
jgi:DNA-binding response OmpR family regulator